MHEYASKLAQLEWPQQLYQQIQSFEPERKQAWLALWQHAATAKSLKKPSQAWLKTAQQLIVPVQAEFSQQLIEWTRLILQQSSTYWHPFSTQNEPVIKGLIWLFLYVQHVDKADVLGQVVRFGYAILCRDPRTQVVAEAALYVIGQMGMAGLVQLSKLRRKATEQKAKKPIEKMLYATAKTLQLSAEYLADLAVPEVPDFEGFVDGQSIYCIGAYRAVIQVVSAQRVEVIWKTQDQVLPERPKGVNGYSRMLSQLQQEHKALSELLMIQGRRLEDSLLQHRIWIYPLWETLLENHRVVSWLVRRLVWRFETDGQVQHGVYTDGQWCDVVGQPLQHLTEQTLVQLWQPSFSTTEEVLAWQQLLVKRQIVQPFAQAFRDMDVVASIEIEAKQQGAATSCR